MRSLQTLLRLILIQPPTLVLPAQTNVGAEEPKIRYIGRFERVNPAAAGFDWSYSTTKFQGTSCTVNLDGPHKYFDSLLALKQLPSSVVSGGLRRLRGGRLSDAKAPKYSHP